MSKRLGWIKKNPSKDFYVVGRIDDNIKEFVGNLPNVIFTGYVTNEELAYLYSHTDGFILPSTYEGFGLPVLEALNCGTPVICSNTSSIPEVGGEYVEYFDPYNIDEIAKRIDENLNKELDYDKVKLYTEQFNWNKTAKELKKEINKFNEEWRRCKLLL